MLREGLELSPQSRFVSHLTMNAIWEIILAGVIRYCGIRY